MGQQQCAVSINIGIIEDQSLLMMMMVETIKSHISNYGRMYETNIYSSTIQSVLIILGGFIQ